MARPADRNALARGRRGGEDEGGGQGERRLAMPSHRLVLKRTRTNAVRIMEWDDTRFVLTTANGRVFFETPVAEVHFAFDPIDLFVEGIICHPDSGGMKEVKKNRAALADLRQLVEAAIGADAEYRAKLKRMSVRCIWWGLAMSVFGGSLLGLYCWYVSWAPDPPPWVMFWMTLFGWMIRGGLLLLMGSAGGGLIVFYSGVRLRMLVRRIEHRLDDLGLDDVGLDDARCRDF